MDTKALRQKILDLAIRGKLVPQDPNDEPASVLLERIRAEKQQMVKEGKLKAKDLKNDTVIFVGDDNLHYEKSDKVERCIDNEIPFEIPDSWKWVRLNNIVSLLGDGIHGTPLYDSKGNNYFINGTNIKNDRIIITDNTKLVSDEEALKHTRTLCDNTLLVSINGTLGNVAYYRGENIVLGKSVCYFNLLGVHKYYIGLFLKSFYVQQYLKKSATGSTIKNVPLSAMRSMLVPIPPFQEQARIANLLKNIFLETDIIENQKNALCELIDNTKSKILNLAIRGKLVPQDSNEEPASVLLERIRHDKEELIKAGKLKRDKRESVIFRGDDNSYYETIGSKTVNIKDELPYNIPSTWAWVRLGAIGIWGAGATPNRAHSEYYGGNIPWLKTGDLNDDYITEIPETITELALKETSVKLNPVGSILIAMYGATIGKLGILTKPATTNQACCACCPVEGVYNKYLFYFLMSHKSKFINSGIGGAQPNISKEKIVATLMPLPPINEQKAIVTRIEKLSFLLNSINANMT